jgi:cytochrome P450
MNYAVLLSLQIILFELPFFNREKKPLRTLQNFMTDIVKDCRELLNAESSEECYLNESLIMLVDGKLLDDEEFCTDMNAAIFGIHNTTKTTLTFLFYSLAKHPEVQQKIYEEVAPFLNDRYKTLDAADLEDFHNRKQ